MIFYARCSPDTLEQSIADDPNIIFSESDYKEQVEDGEVWTKIQIVPMSKIVYELVKREMLL